MIVNNPFYFARNLYNTATFTEDLAHEFRSERNEERIAIKISSVDKRFI